MLKNLWRKYGINPLDQMLKKTVESGGQKILICWNRGLGDVALGIYPLIYRIRQWIADAEVVILTRPDLEPGFRLLKGIKVYADPTWKRGEPIDLDRSLERVGLERSGFDLILERPDPTRWLMRHIGKLTPKLEWNDEWDALAERFQIDRNKRCLGIHLQTQTQYGYEKNWPLDHWKALIDEVVDRQGWQVVLFGHSVEGVMERNGVIDLRGKTNLYEMLSIIKNMCDGLIAPDSGVLSLTYYIDAVFPLKVVSLWADPRQGVLKQKVASPNPKLQHEALVAPGGDLTHLSVERVLKSLFTN